MQCTHTSKAGKRKAVQVQEKKKVLQVGHKSAANEKRQAMKLASKSLIELVVEVEFESATFGL
jgi:hypothetical protein